jgi:hypothetical protein
MKKLGFLALALTFSFALMSTPTLAVNNDSVATYQQQPPPLPEDAAAAYSDYYGEKDETKKYEKAKAFLEKFPTVDQYWKNGPQAFIKRYELTKVYDKCKAADAAFFGSPNEANLNNFIAACDVWINKALKPDIYYTTRISLGTGYGVLAGFYKDTNRGETYTGKALPLLTPTAAPEGWKQTDWDNFRKENTGRLTQYQGLYKLRQTSPDYEAAIKSLTEAASYKDGPAVKDPNTYLLRAEATTGLYTKLNAEYSALNDTDKVGERGKALLNQIYPVVEKMANDYARVVALTEGNNVYKAIYDDAKAQCEQFVTFLNKDGKPDDLYKLFKGDVSAPDAKIKTEDSVSTAPPTTPTSGKGPKTAPLAAAGGTTPAGGGAKTPTKATTKTKTPPKKRK